MTDGGPYCGIEQQTKEIKVTDYFLNEKSANKPTNMIGVQVPKFIVIHEVSKNYNYEWCDIEHYRRLIMLHSTPKYKILRLSQKEIEIRKKLKKIIISKNGEILSDCENGDIIKKTGEIINPRMDFAQERLGAPPYTGWGSTVGYHYLVSDKKIYHFIADNISSEHTGTDYGNSNSIGIERIVCKGTNWELAIYNQAKLTATLMIKWKIPLYRVVTHMRIQELFGDDEQKRLPKQCPYALIMGYKQNLKEFFNQIVFCLNNRNIYVRELKQHKITDEDNEFINEEICRIENEKRYKEIIKQSKFRKANQIYEKIINYN